MMRTYGSIQTNFWTHPDVCQLSDQAKLLAVYLLTSMHTNMLGCFRIPKGYVAEDLKWSFETVEKAFFELEKIDFLAYESLTGWVMIYQFLTYHPIDNPNQGKSINKLFHDVPKNLHFIGLLIQKLLLQQKHLDDEFIKQLKTLSKPFRNQEQEQEQNQEQELMSGKPDAGSFDENNPQAKISSVTSDAEAILQFLNEKTGRAYRLADPNLKLIMARLKSGVTPAQCFQVIAKKTREWKGDSKMNEYLRPATLFDATKFEQYVGELVVSKEEQPHEQ